MKMSKQAFLLLFTKASLSMKQSSQRQAPAAKWTTVEKVTQLNRVALSRDKQQGTELCLIYAVGVMRWDERGSRLESRGINPGGLIGGLTCFKGFVLHTPSGGREQSECESGVGRLTGSLSVKLFVTCHRLLTRFYWECQKTVDAPVGSRVSCLLPPC